MFAQERRLAITKIVRRQRRIHFADLLRRMRVSPATLRRDLAQLEMAGDLIRVHGGVLDPSYVRSEISFDERLLRNGQAKRAIAAAAVALVPEGATLFVDAGSTCLEAGKALLGRKDVRIITHSVPLVEAGLSGAAEILCLGGALRKLSGALTGGEALGALTVLRADVAFIGATGLDPAWGCTTTELSEATLKQAILARATRRVLLADATKWGNPSTVRFAEWKDFQDWITDKKPPAREMRLLSKSGIHVRQA